MHLTLVTSVRTTKRSVTNRVIELWQRTLKRLGHHYDPEHKEVIRNVTRLRDEERDENYRVDEFRPFEDSSYSTNMERAESHMRYLSYTAKARWEPQHVVRQVELLTCSV